MIKGKEATRGRALEISSFRKIEELSLVQETARRFRIRLADEGFQQIGWNSSEDGSMFGFLETPLVHP